MRLRAASGRDLWLAYGMNVHPGGTLESTRAAIRDTVLPLRERLGARGPFGVALRLDAATALRLRSDPERLEDLGRALRAEDLVPFTANGFVAGAFHGRPLKEAVYAPSWREPERRFYTEALAEVMAGLARPGARISISTAPGSWRGWEQGEEVDRACAAQVAAAARGLVDLGRRTGVRVRLGLEPEPGCTVQSTEEVLAFFAGPLAEALGGDEAARRHVGVCYDVCHQAVVHEEAAEALSRLEAAGVAVVKMQASCALEVPDPADPDARAALAAFDEPVYLHQVGAVDGRGCLHVAADLPEALASGGAWSGRSPWRVHFHVPVFREQAAGPLATTRAHLDRALGVLARDAVTDHLEIETYTWDVLPESERRAGSGFDLVDALAREYEHVLGVLAGHGVEPVKAPGRPSS